MDQPRCNSQPHIIAEQMEVEAIHNHSESKFPSDLTDVAKPSQLTNAVPPINESQIEQQMELEPITTEPITESQIEQQIMELEPITTERKQNNLKSRRKKRLIIDGNTTINLNYYSNDNDSIERCIISEFLLRKNLEKKDQFIKAKLHLTGGSRNIQCRRMVTRKEDADAVSFQDLIFHNKSCVANNTIINNNVVVPTYQSDEMVVQSQEERNNVQQLVLPPQTKNVPSQEEQMAIQPVAEEIIFTQTISSEDNQQYKSAELSIDTDYIATMLKKLNMPVADISDSTPMYVLNNIAYSMFYVTNGKKHFCNLL